MFEDIDPSTLFVITNTIYFDGTWQTQFDQKNTQNRNFHIDSETITTVPMMRLEDTNFNYASTDILEILELPYRGNQKSMFIFLPKTINGIHSLEDNTITVDSISELKEKMNQRHIIVMIPKFSLETDYDLVKTLQEMGVSMIFAMMQTWER